jgi:hypothetical protein
MKHHLGMCILLALWTLLVAPATCGGGLLGHACADDGRDFCNHENDCPSDPCNVAHDVTAVAKTVVKADLTICVPAPTSDTAEQRTGDRPASADPSLRRLPLPADALPLIC